MTEHFRKSVMSHNHGRPTNQCRQCGARYLPDAPRCPYHRDVEVWVRGALVRFAVIWWPPQGGTGPQAEIVHKELVGRVHFRSYGHVVRDGVSDAVTRQVLRDFWEVEEYESDHTVWRKWSDEREDSSTTSNEEAA